MSKNRELKVQVVADIVEKLKACQSLVVCSYSGLTVEQATNLRKLCRRAVEKLGAGVVDLIKGKRTYLKTQTAEHVLWAQLIADGLDVFYIRTKAHARIHAVGGGDDAHFIRIVVIRLA